MINKPNGQSKPNFIKSMLVVAAAVGVVGCSNGKHLSQNIDREPSTIQIDNVDQFQLKVDQLIANIGDYTKVQVDSKSKESLPFERELKKLFPDCEKIYGGASSEQKAELKKSIENLIETNEFANNTLFANFPNGVCGVKSPGLSL